MIINSKRVKRNDILKGRGFVDGAENITKCLDKISTDEPIYLEVSGAFSGHAFFSIRNGIEKSQKKVIIYKVSEK
jgi:hypothetical protein